MYDVIYKQDRENPDYSVVSSGHKTIASAKMARKVSGDLVVFEGTINVVPTEEWLWKWERADGGYAKRQVDRAIAAGYPNGKEAYDAQVKRFSDRLESLLACVAAKVTWSEQFLGMRVFILRRNFSGGETPWNIRVRLYRNEFVDHRASAKKLAKMILTTLVDITEKETDNIGVTVGDYYHWIGEEFLTEDTDNTGGVP